MRLWIIAVALLASACQTPAPEAELASVSPLWMRDSVSLARALSQADQTSLRQMRIMHPHTGLVVERGAQLDRFMTRLANAGWARRDPPPAQAPQEAAPGAVFNAWALTDAGATHLRALLAIVKGRTS